MDVFFQNRHFLARPGNVTNCTVKNVPTTLETRFEKTFGNVPKKTSTMRPQRFIFHTASYDPTYGSTEESAMHEAS